jgi:hypothetical protein
LYPGANIVVAESVDDRLADNEGRDTVQTHILTTSASHLGGLEITGRKNSERVKRLRQRHGQGQPDRGHPDAFGADHLGQC